MKTKLQDETTETFVKLNHQLLKRTDLTIQHKVIISYIDSFSTAKNKVCYEKQSEIAEALGMTLDSFKPYLKDLTETGIITSDLIKNMGVTTKRQYKGRKAYTFNDNIEYNTTRKERLEMKKNESEITTSKEVITETKQVQPEIKEVTPEPSIEPSIKASDEAILSRLTSKDGFECLEEPTDEEIEPVKEIETVLIDEESEPDNEYKLEEYYRPDENVSLTDFLTAIGVDSEAINKLSRGIEFDYINITKLKEMMLKESKVSNTKITFFNIKTITDLIKIPEEKKSYSFY
ncbi:hypothetical protein [Olleya marilimosa]|uniref:hypothetical protein n=1 Tax=Olleya marilimosa TaxID=272164 RepID=UPI0030ECD2FB|tara:strand:+ start:96921 stop:97790 length:870 start_codon:yes stop_codon:yes gene_type:complete